MNDVIQLLKSHRTYRDFDPSFEVPEADVQTIIDCARQAPSWMNGQHYSIVEVQDKILKQKIIEALPKQKQIANCSRFFIFLADLYRMSVSSEINKIQFSPKNEIENLLIAITDTALCAQNALVTAESLGYGVCFVGSVREITEKLISWLQLPEYTFPIVGLCIGKPNVEMKIKPRLPHRAVVFKNQYSTKDLKDDILDYQKIMIEFAEARETLPWTEKFTKFYSLPEDYSCSNVSLLKKQKLLR